MNNESKIISATANLKPFCNIFIHEKLKLYMLLTDEECGDGDTYVITDLIADGWTEFCNTQRGHKKATLFMEHFYPEYQKFTYHHSHVPLNRVKPFIDKYHRHHVSPQGCNFAFAVYLGDQMIGAITAGRPVNRYLDDGETLEVTRVCVKPGYKNLCSYLYSHMTKVAKTLNYKRVITYTLEQETGISCIAAGFSHAYVSAGGTWNCSSRKRSSTAPEGPKNVWMVVL